MRITIPTEVQRLAKFVLLGSVAVLLLCSLPSSASAQNAETTFTPAQAQAVINSIFTNAGGWSTTDSSDLRRTSQHEHTDGRTATCSFGSSDDVQSYRCTITNTDGTRNELSSTGGQTLSRDRDSDNEITAASVAATPADPSACSIIRMDLCIQKALTWGMSAIVGGVAWVIVSIAAFMLWIVGGLFNWVVIKTVFEFGTYFGTSSGMLIAWGIMRDLGNIILLFSFIFMGLATILNTHALDEYSARKALPRLIIFAVLLNFSLFAAQFVIDVSNGFASVFTAQAGFNCSNNDTIDATTGLPSQEACANDGIAGRVLQMAGVSGVFLNVDIGKFMSAPEKHAPVYIGLAIFITITAVVLLAAAIMLVMRAVMLCLLMVLSPIGFAGMAVPPLQEFANKWWKQLISNAFFAPIYLLMVLISLKIVEGLIGENSNRNFAEALINGGTNAPQIFVIFAVVIGFMVGALVVAKSMGAAGADFATKQAGGLVLGTYGFAGRRLIGGSANKIATAVRSSDWAQKNRGAANLLLKTTGIDKARESSFSARTLATNLGKGAHLDFGKPNKTAAHGIHGIEEQAVKDRDKYFKDLKQTDRQKGVADETQEELKEIDAKLDKRIEKEREAVEAQRQKVAEARLKNDEATLEAERRILDQRIKEFEDKNNPKNPDLDEEAKELLSRKAVLQKRLSTWKAQGEKEKLENYIENSLHGNWYPPGSIGEHADHEAAANIRKNGTKSKMDKAFDDFKKAMKDDDDGGGAPVTAPTAPAAPAGGGGDHGAAH